MGLDVSLHKNCKLGKFKEDDSNCFKAFTLEGFEDRIKNLKKGKYYISESQKHLISYSYGSHSDFRDMLCDISKEPRDWRKEDISKDRPFFELIQFADNEGCIDWESSAALHEDFVKFRDEAAKQMDEWWLGVYDTWMGLFGQAKEVGNVVRFH